MKPTSRARLRFVAWACVFAILLAAAAPASAGVPQAVLVPAGPIHFDPGPFRVLRGAEETPPPDLVALRAVAARAPPLA